MRQQRQGETVRQYLPNLWRRVLAYAAITTMVASAAHSSAASNPADTKLANEFNSRARGYVDWRDKTAGNTPSATNSPEKLDGERQALANKLRTARAGAKQGEIFAPEIARFFRKQIAATLAGNKGHAIRVTLQHAEPVKGEIQINQSYPENVPLQSTPPTLLLNLPELPKGLEYRILGRELVLLDTDANIVVDYVPNALPDVSK